MMGKEDILTLTEKKMEICKENAESSRTSKHFPLFDSTSFKRSISFSSISFFTMSFHFTPILWPQFTLISSTHYPPPVLVKHPIWYLNHANLFISVQGTLYGVHQAYFDDSSYFVPSWTSSTHYSLYPEETYHNAQFHSTILMRCRYINWFLICTNPRNFQTLNQLGNHWNE